MAVAALLLYIAFAALGFGWRSWAQHRLTGSTGFRGVSGRPGSLEWLAGVGFIVAILLGLAAPVLQILGEVTPLDVIHTPWIQAIGTIVSVVGIGGTVYAQNDMGESWRIGVDPAESTTLVRHGVFAIVRNPIFSAMLIFAAGIVLMTPNTLALAAFVLLLATIEVQVRRVEEPYLHSTHGDEYRSYTQNVGRFFPGIGRS